MENTNLKKSLIKVLVLLSAIVLILIVLAIWDNRSAILSQLAARLF